MVTDQKESRESRKGPWTEQEDLQLVWFVRLFGERRWDFLAKVSGLSGGGFLGVFLSDFNKFGSLCLAIIYAGLNRTGKSCRLRWVNYLHPGLKRGRMTPQEEQLVLDLHAKWGNRWSRIARKLPGRTDNEIKNYWRTHMRKKAQEQKKGSSHESPSSSSLSTNSSSSHSNNNSNNNEAQSWETQGLEESQDTIMGEVHNSIDQFWNEIETASELGFEGYKDIGCYANLSYNSMPSPIWECNPEPLWRMDDDEVNKMTIPDSAHSQRSNSTNNNY
ncbi:hypothetical protein LUZ60_004075 [Juncus effusus]|nr:hypothetical protein LUZ60_004075 [Juncus effusus]